MEIDRFIETLGHMDAVRLKAGYLAIEGILLLSRTNVIFDPFSVLISKDVRIGENNTIYPTVRIDSGTDGTIEIGNGNVFFSDSVITAVSGTISIGMGNELGENGICIHAESGAIRISDRTRLKNGPNILDGTDIGAGCQVLGDIKVHNTVLEDGEDYRAIDPNDRGAVLKGYGYARNILLKKGSVIFGKGDFDQFPVELQEKYHPGWKRDQGQETEKGSRL